MKFVAKLVVYSVGSYVIGKVFERTKVLEQFAERAAVVGVGLVDEALTKVAQRAAAAAQGGGAQ